MPSAIVTGATGILGREIVRALGNKPEEWPVVHALSRSQTESWPENVTPLHADLTKSASDMAKQLEGVKCEYLFFAAYLEQGSEEDNCKVNGAMLENLLEALKITGVTKDLKRVVLTTGAKQYGLHLGQTKQPMEENDTWVEGPGRPPNFYYVQQRILSKKAKEDGYDWVVTYPNDVIGVAKSNFMNLSTALGLYCSISKEIDGNLVFPGSETFYSLFDCFTYSRLHADFCTWAALSPSCSNEAFNVVNGDVQSWQNLWPRFAERYHCHIPRNQFEVFCGDDAGSVLDLAEEPPLTDSAARLGLEGKTRQSQVQQKVDLVKWSKREDVKSAWTKLRDRDGLGEDSFEKATWGFLGFVLGRNFNIVLNMSKARKFGYTGYIDTWDAFSEVLDDLEKLKVLPKSG